MARATSTTNRGFTLAESLIAAAVLAITAVAVIGPISASYQQTQFSEEASTATELAQQLLDEISAKPLADPTDSSRVLGPEIDESGRAAFDNVDDYHGYSDTTANLRALDGSVIDWKGRGTYQRSVQVEYRLEPAGSPVLAGDFALATIRVTAPSGQVFKIHRLFSRFEVPY